MLPRNQFKDSSYMDSSDDTDEDYRIRLSCEQVKNYNVVKKKLHTFPTFSTSNSLCESWRLQPMVTDSSKLLRVASKLSTSFFDVVPDNVITCILSSLSSDDLCRCAKVCRRWYKLVWNPVLWTSISISNRFVDVDRAMKSLTKILSCNTPTVCVFVESINLRQCERLTDRGLYIIARRCPELRQLVLDGCFNITNIALFEVVSNCVNLKYLSVSGEFDHLSYLKFV